MHERSHLRELKQSFTVPKQGGKDFVTILRILYAAALGKETILQIKKMKMSLFFIYRKLNQNLRCKIQDCCLFRRHFFAIAGSKIRHLATKEVPFSLPQTNKDVAGMDEQEPEDLAFYSHERGVINQFAKRTKP